MSPPDLEWAAAYRGRQQHVGAAAERAVCRILAGCRIEVAESHAADQLGAITPAKELRDRDPCRASAASLDTTPRAPSPDCVDPRRRASMRAHPLLARRSACR